MPTLPRTATSLPVARGNPKEFLSPLGSGLDVKVLPMIELKEATGGEFRVYRASIGYIGLL